MAGFRRNFTISKGVIVDPIMIDDSDDEDIGQIPTPAVHEEDDDLSFIAYEPPINLHHQVPIPASGSIPINPQMAQSEDINPLQIGAGKIKTIKFHDGKIYKLFEGIFVDKEIIPDENTNNLELVITSLKEVLLDEIHSGLQKYHGLK